MKRIVLLIMLVVFPIAGTDALAQEPLQLGQWAQGEALIQTQQDLKDVALGNAPADTFIKTSQVFNANTLQWMADWGLAVKHGRIAWAGPISEWTGQAAATVDATDRVAIAGMCNAHQHLESMHMSVEKAAEVFFPLGETCEFEAAHELGNVFEPDLHLAYWLEGWKVGLRIFPLIPTAAPPTWAEWTAVRPGEYDLAKWTELYKDFRVAGADELMDLPNLLDAKMPGYNDMWYNKVMGTQNARRPVEGHMSGVWDWNRINALAGVLTSNHENRTAFGVDLSAGEIAYRKLLAGVFLEVRGTRDVAEVLPYLLEKGADLRNVSTVTDDRSVEEQMGEMGGMNGNLKQLIAAGVPLEDAIAMATINPATHFQLDQFVGCLNPGCFADVVMLRGDPKDVDIAEVYVGGTLVARDGKMVVTLPKVDMTPYTYDSVDFGREMVPADFEIKGPAGATTGQAAVLGPFYFGKAEREPVSIQDGIVTLTPEQRTRFGVWSLADRYHGTKGVESGATNVLYKNMGPLTPDTAICMTEAHDSHVAQAIQNSPAAAALCMNTLASINGGYVLVSGGVVLSAVPLEVGGLMTTADPQSVAAGFRAFWQEVDKLEWIGGKDGAIGMRRMRFIPLTCAPWVDQATAISEYSPTGLIDVTTMEPIQIVTVQ